jgi:hypothetical protein
MPCLILGHALLERGKPHTNANKEEAMKIQRIGLWILAVLGAAISNGNAKAQTPNQYQILETLYGTYVSNSSATANFWNKYLVSGSTFTAGNPANGVTVTTEVAFPKYPANWALSTTTPSGKNTTTFGGVTGTSAWDGKNGNAFSNSAMRTYTYSNGTFSMQTGGGSNPPSSDGTITFKPVTNTFAFTVNPISSTISNGASISQSTIDSQSKSTTVTSTNSSDMVAYRIMIGGQVNYILMWNLSGAGSLSSGNYNDLVLDVYGLQNPEPTSLALMGLGAFGLIAYRLRRRIKGDDAIADKCIA